MQIPDLSLSLGQVLWSLSFGEAPKQHMVDKLNYLRQLGIPFPKKRKGAIAIGSGNRAIYGYDELIECGVAYQALLNGMKPADIVKILVGYRVNMREFYRQALLEQPAGCLTGDWVSSKGRSKPVLADSLYLRLHDRYAETPNQIEAVSTDNDMQALMELFDPTERFGNVVVKVVPLTILAIQWTYWALLAPELRTGPKE